MTLDKAIETLASFHSWFGVDFCTRDLEAIKLGIEALKALDDCRKGDCTYHEELLPGETES